MQVCVEGEQLQPAGGDELLDDAADLLGAGASAAANTAQHSQQGRQVREQWVPSIPKCNIFTFSRFALIWHMSKEVALRRANTGLLLSSSPPAQPAAASQQNCTEGAQVPRQVVSVVVRPAANIFL